MSTKRPKSYSLWISLSGARRQLTLDEAKAVNNKQLLGIPRHGAFSVSSATQFQNTLELLILQLDEYRQEYQMQGFEDWWHMADLLDDACDILDAVRGLCCNGQWKTPATICLVDGDTNKSAHGSVQQAKLDKVYRMGTSAIKTTEQFIERVEGLVLTVDDLRSRYYAEGRENWWHMVDLLDEVGDLWQAVCPSNLNQMRPVIRLEVIQHSTRGMP